MPLEFIDLNFDHVFAVDGDNRRAMRKVKWHRIKLVNSTKMITQNLGKNNDKTKIKFKMKKELKYKLLIW